MGETECFESLGGGRGVLLLSASRWVCYISFTSGLHLEATLFPRNIILKILGEEIPLPRATKRLWCLLYMGDDTICSVFGENPFGHQVMANEISITNALSVPKATRKK